MLKRKVYDILNAEPEAGVVGKVFVGVITALILLSVVMVIAESVASIAEAYAGFFFWAELISVAVFTVEYVARLWTITVTDRYRHVIKGRVEYAGSFMMVIDLLAILPFYLPMFIAVDLRVLRLLRLLRLARIFKLGRYARSMEVFARVFYEKRSELAVAGVFFGFYLIIASSLLYLAEHDAQPEGFSSIPAAMWWGAAALTTVGYGDIFPITALGKLLGAVLAVFGIGMFALPVGILATGFVEAFDGLTKEKEREAAQARERTEPGVEEGPGGEEAGGSGAPGQRIILLERLGRLRAEGHLTEEEFRTAKGLLLNS
jgi:voltage-gated potassium channel